MHIYFAEYGGQIKIGISRNVDKRLLQINSQAGIFLSEIGRVPGDFSQERALHSILDDYRIRGEWYRDCNDMRGFIARCLKDLGVAIRNPLGERTMFGGVARILWPNETAACLADIAKTDERTAKRWLRGEYEPPLSVVLAVIHEMLREQTELNL